ncbi:hypothetical protein GCM10007852_00250 [Agaribacter marinus]|uniref:3-deoxy-D-manno-octulosonic acid kinase n=2 Tax=Agaribacter marinus TaxID=1431249 RepID=A0AA37STY3_9ALTE|nr:hypothetical protein GCM10007852_00250 [Agaribacter marinus]
MYSLQHKFVMTLQLHKRNCNEQNEVIITTATSTAIHLNHHHFAKDFLQQNQLIQQIRTGRGEVFFFNLENTQCVLRHYRRGGLVAKLSDDKFLWKNIESTRVYKELKLLQTMQKNALPVPMPIAGRVIQRGIFYTADIITQAIPNTQELHAYLQNQKLHESLWEDIGYMVKRMHNLNICHDDLNVKNVLINDTDQVFLIDFDKCYVRKDGDWKKQNISRFRRSIDKHHDRLGSSYQFAKSDWDSFLLGYSQKV